MKQLHYFICIFLCVLTSCVTDTPGTRPTTALIRRNGTPIVLESLWPVDEHGTYLERVEMTLKDGTSHNFSVHIEIEPTSVKAIAFHDLLGRIYTLSFTKDELKTQIHTLGPFDIETDDILMDFLISHLSLDKIQTLSPKLNVTETNDGSWVISGGGDPLWHLWRSSPLSSLMWETLTLRSIPHGYTLKVKAVPLS